MQTGLAFIFANIYKCWNGPFLLLKWRVFVCLWLRLLLADCYSGFRCSAPTDIHDFIIFSHNFMQIWFNVSRLLSPVLSHGLKNKSNLYLYMFFFFCFIFVTAADSLLLRSVPMLPCFEIILQVYVMDMLTFSPSFSLPLSLNSVAVIYMWFISSWNVLSFHFQFQYPPNCRWLQRVDVCLLRHCHTDSTVLSLYFTDWVFCSVQFVCFGAHFSSLCFPLHSEIPVRHLEAIAIFSAGKTQPARCTAYAVRTTFQYQSKFISYQTRCGCRLQCSWTF